MDSTEIIRAKMPELDSLRGVAILLVVFYHGFFWSNGLTGLSGIAKLFVNLTRIGWLGVNLFFSALRILLITGILADSKTNKHYYRRFYLRRALRILPAFFYALLLVLSFIPSQSKAYLILSFFYLSNLASPSGHSNDLYNALVTRGGGAFLFRLARFCSSLFRLEH